MCIGSLGLFSSAVSLTDLFIASRSLYPLRAFRSLPHLKCKSFLKQFPQQSHSLITISATFTKLKWM